MKKVWTKRLENQLIKHVLESNEPITKTLQAFATSKNLKLSSINAKYYAMKKKDRFKVAEPQEKLAITNLVQSEKEPIEITRELNNKELVITIKVNI